MNTHDRIEPVVSARVAVLLGDKSNPFWTGMAREYESLAPEVGMSIDCFWADPEKDRQAQLEKLFSILEGPVDVSKDPFDAVVINPIGNKNLVPGIMKAAALGVPILDVGAKTDQESVRVIAGKTYHPVRTVDFFAQGLMAGNYIGRRLTIAGKSSAAIIEGRPDSAQSVGRSAGAARALAGFPGIRLVCREQADFDRSKARVVARRILEGALDLKAFFCANDVMALGAADAVRSLSGTREIAIVGVDLTPESRDAIKQGFMTATVAFSPASVARVVLDAVARVMAGKEVEKGYTVESTLVTAENIDSYAG